MMSCFSLLGEIEREDGNLNLKSLESIGFNLQYEKSIKMGRDFIGKIRSKFNLEYIPNYIIKKPCVPIQMRNIIYIMNHLSVHECYCKHHNEYEIDELINLRLGIPDEFEDLDDEEEVNYEEN